MAFELTQKYTLTGQVVAPEHEELELKAPGTSKPHHHAIIGTFGKDTESYLIMRGSLNSGHPYLVPKMKLRYVPEYLPSPDNSHEKIDRMADDLTNAFSATLKQASVYAVPMTK
jgi:hypothetical protein